MSSETPVEFERRDGCTIFRATGPTTLDRAIALVTNAITSAREQGDRKLLVDISGLSGFEPPGLGHRFLFVNEWARAAEGRLRVALVTERRMIDPNKYGISVARSAGMDADVFTSEQSALAWLQRAE